MAKNTFVAEVTFKAQKIKLNQADFTDWMFFLPSNLVEEISCDPEPSAQILKALYHGIPGKTKITEL